MSGTFHPEEERSLKGQLAQGENPLCPRCGSPLQVTPVIPSPEVAYVRTRAVVECLACRKRVVLDRKGA
jgi:hypothetical protein